MKLHLGCGKNYLKGYINIDVNKKIKADKYCDVIKLPFKTNSVDEIRADHLLEDFEDMKIPLKEWYRVLKKGGKLKITVPYAFSNYAFVNPEHKHYFVWDTLNFFCKGVLQDYFYDFHFKLKKREFRIIGQNFLRPILVFLAKVFSRTPRFYERFLKGIIQMDEIYYELEK